jgi:hypothetical protein
MTGTWWQWARSSCTTHQWPTSHLLAHIFFVVHSVVLFIIARPALSPALPPLQKQADICRHWTDVTRHTPRIQGQVPYEQSNLWKSGPIEQRPYAHRVLVLLLNEIRCRLVTRVYWSAKGIVFHSSISLLLNLSRIAQAASHTCVTYLP